MNPRDYDRLDSDSCAFTATKECDNQNLTFGTGTGTVKNGQVN